MSKSIGPSRRQLLSGAAAGAVSLFATPSLAASPRGNSWSREADVVIIGSGAAAMAAAVAATQQGSKVVLLEKSAAAGGTSAKSAGAYWIPNNHLLRAKGLQDPKAEVLRYMARDSFPAQFRDDVLDLGIGAEQFALLETYYDHAAPIIQQLDHDGILKGTIIEVEDYFDHSAFDRHPRQRAMVPLRPDGKIGRGLELVRQLKAWLVAHDVPFLFNHSVNGLIKNDRGQAVGVRADTPSGPVAIRARRAVVFGTGGFSQNQRLMRTFLRGPIHGACSVPFAQGDFVRIGSEAGATLGNMNNGWYSEVVLEQALASSSVSVTMEFPPGDSMIIVNKYGNRVVDEKRNYNVRGRAHFVFDEIENEYPNDLLFMIFDQRSLELFGGNMHMPMPGVREDYVISAPNMSTMGAAIQARLDSHEGALGKRQLSPAFSAGLLDQIKRFNVDARAGVDTQFKRGTYPYDVDWHRNIDSVERTDTKWPHNPGPNVTIYPISSEGPYYAIILGGGLLDTNGGPVINKLSQVLHADGKPIPGLYGAGNCIAAPGGAGYWGAGATLGPALTFGTIAGRNAAAEPIKEV